MLMVVYIVTMQCFGTCYSKPGLKKKPSKPRAGKGKTGASVQGINPKVHPDAAGIDIGSEEFVAAIPAGRDPSGSVKTFSTFTSGVEALRDWLLKYGVNTVALEPSEAR